LPWATGSAASSLTGARRFRLADPDTLGPTNLNRLAGSVCDFGVPKLTLAMRRTLETDPYSDIEAFEAGYGPEVANTPRLSTDTS
jgi:tRNA A37 threonylcarbamoyladenosine dehydratase